MSAIYCKTCDAYYHLNCFELDDGGQDDDQNEAETGEIVIKLKNPLH